MATSYSDFFKRVLIVFAVLITPVLIWYLFGVIMMTFGAIILAMVVRLAAQPMMQRLRMPEPLALIFSGLFILVVIVGAGYLFGTRIANEMQDVIQRIGDAGKSIQTSLQGSDIGRFVLSQAAGSNVSLTGVLSGFLTVSSSVLEGLIIVLISGAYIAAQPRLYRQGMIWLFPPAKHARAAEIIDGIGEALRLWLLGQLVQMALIGLLATFAVWIIGVPSPLALGMIAAVGEFIPYLGPILAGIPAVLVAMTKSPEAALWTLVAYLIIHQIEGQIIGPIVQRHMVSIPPAVMLLGIAAITYLFGMVAIIFAAPIAVVIFAAVNLVYVRDTLGEKTELTRKLR